MAASRSRWTRRTATGKSYLRSILIAVVVVLIALYLFAQFVRRTSMFVPSRFPEGVWDARGAEDVTFMTSDGVRLHGWLFRSPFADRRSPTDPTANGERRSANVLLVYCHGNAGNITDRAPIAAELARRGVSTLLFDWRGYGKSEGRPSESALLKDALAAYDFAQTLAAGSPSRDIAMYGESLGGPYAAYVAAHRKVRCVIIENSFPSLRAMGNTLYHPLPLGWFAPFALRTTRWLNAAGVPVLVMHGKRDVVIPFSLGQELYDGLRVPKELLVSETGGHCETANAEGARYYDAVVRFVMR
jgi:uncharacterized protein